MNSLEKFLLIVALPTVLISSFLEAFFLSQKKAYDWRAMAVSIFDLIFRTFINIFLPISIATPLVNFVWAHRLTTLPLDAWQGVAILFIGQEFCYYWYHRAAHRIRWFWCNHSVHHSPNELNLSAAYRIGLVGKLTGVAFFFLPLVWLGFSIQIVLDTLTLNLLYQFWIHATWIPKLGWMEYIFNTPSAHRVHHASNLEYLDGNYGGVLIIFDRLYGTYIQEQDSVLCKYGLVHPQLSYNPFVVEFSSWKSLWQDLLEARNPRAFLGYIFMPPGWKPNGLGETTEDLRRMAAASYST